MNLSSFKNPVLAVSMLSGTIIGVGFFSLPYIASKVGIWTMLGYFLVLGPLSILIHSFFGKVALATPDFFRFPSYVKIHLGKTAQKFAFVSTILGLFGAILAYLIVGGEFLANLLSPIFGGGNVAYTILYFGIGALLIFFGVKAISKIEFWALLLFFLILVIFFLKGFPQIRLINLFPDVDIGAMKNWFLPYGAVLFSLSGASLIPEVEEILGQRKHLLNKVIILSILIAILIYLSFVFLILGVSGSQTTEFAITGLKGFLGNSIFNLGLFFGILTTFTSFIALGLNLKNVFRFDLKIKKHLSWAITCFVPLALFLAGIKQFIPVISFVGGILLGFDGILILLMYKKIKPKSIFIYPLALIFLGGIIYQIIYFF
ncbi:MAG: hypothetical protein HYT19_01280 [Candidatus Nealsonbacteria bacterium]|nr:hypothetical protein [Candidatus Nealsonbacteria bacterium]